MNPRLAVSASLLSTLLLIAGCTPSYNETLQQKIRQSLGDDYKTYTSFSYPTDNFGLATMYTSPAGTTIDDKDFLCDTWNCLGIGNPPTETLKLMNVAGFAAVGANGGAITLTEKEQKSLSLNAILPKVFQVLNLTGGFKKDNITTVSLQIGQAWPRKLRRQEMINYFTTLPASSLEKQAFIAGNVSLVVADVVVDKMTVDVGVTRDLAANLDAKLGGLPNAVFSNSELSVGMTSSTAGNYTFTVTRPVIVLRLAKRQPTAGGLSAPLDDNWLDWLPVNPPKEPHSHAQSP